MVYTSLITVSQSLLDIVSNSKLLTSVISAILLITELLRLSIPKFLEQWKLKGFFGEGNSLNYIFADHGYQIFTTLFFLVLIVAVLARKHLNKTQLPLNNSEAREREAESGSILYFVRSYILRYLLVFVSVLGVLKIREQIRGHTSNEDYGGFNISGHYLTLVTFILCLSFELERSRKPVVGIHTLLLDDTGATYYVIGLSWVIGVLLVSITLIVLIWSVILVITGLFYHTLVERILGTIIAVGFVNFLYYLLFPEPI